MTRKGNQFLQKKKKKVDFAVLLDETDGKLKMNDYLTMVGHLLQNSTMYIYMRQSIFIELQQGYFHSTVHLRVIVRESQAGVKNEGLHTSNFHHLMPVRNDKRGWYLGISPGIYFPSLTTTPPPPLVLDFTDPEAMLNICQV